MAEITDIITKLLERTNENKVSWQTTADEDTFIAVVGNTSTSISTYHGRYRSQEVRFRILNKEGREIERFETGTPLYDESVDFEYVDNALTELYAKARRIALAVDTELDELLKALEE